MTTQSEHPSERLDAWLDGRLAPDEHRELDEHFAVCERCRTVRDVLLASRTALRTAVGDVATPVGLKQRIRDALDREDALEAADAPESPAAVPAELPAAARPARDTVARFPEPREPARWRRRMILPLAAAVAAVLVTILWLWGGAGHGSDPVDAAFAEYRAIGTAELPATLRAADPQQVETRWQQAGIRFAARVLDLGAMGIEVVGGDATRLAGQLAARSVYRGDAGTFLCWMFEGSTASMPPPAERRTDGGIDFLIYRQGDTTVVLWQEGELVCAFAGAGDPEAVIALAFAKAMVPRSAAATNA